MNSDTELELLLLKASINEKAERYDEMAEAMKEAITLAYDNKLRFDISAHILFSVAYKNLVGARRSAWRVLISERIKYDESPKEREVVDTLNTKVVKELCNLSGEVIEIIDAKILKMDNIKNDDRHIIFFLKMKGDYFRYKAEVEEGAILNKSIEEAGKAYQEAFDKAKILSPTSPVRLGLSLNYSVFYYEILKETQRACELAKNSFDEAIAELDSLSEDDYKDSTLIMQLIRDNLTLWTSQPEQNLEPSYERNIEETNGDENL